MKSGEIRNWILFEILQSCATWDTNRWSFDFEGRATNRVFADGSSVSWSYDAGGRLSSKRDARGWRTSYNRDAAGRVVSRFMPTDWYNRIGFSYDEWGALSGAVIDEYGDVPQLAHAVVRDLRGNATNETVGIYGAEYGLSRTFDGFSRLTSLTAVGETAFYGYDTENRLSAVSNAAFTVTYAFTPDGLDAGYTVTFTNGTVVTRAVTRHPYRRGLVTGVTNTVNGIVVSAYAYAHDRLGRVITRNGDVFGYDTRSQVVSADISTNAYSYSYDSIGNSLHFARNAATNLYTANALNQYASVTGAGGTQSLAYDADGNLTAWNGRNFGWNSENRLCEAVTAGSDCGFMRDGSGRCFTDWDYTEDTYTDRVFDGWNPVFERVFDASTELPLSDTVYVWGADLSGTLQGAGGVGGLLAVKRDGTWYVPLYDANGNVTAYVSETGAVVAEYEYDAFGNTIRQSGSLSDSFRHRFSTKPWIAALGAYDYGERLYSPELRRWISRDPIEEEGGVNLYAMCGNDAVNGVDPLGLKALIQETFLYDEQYIHTGVRGAVVHMVKIDVHCNFFNFLRISGYAYRKLMLLSNSNSAWNKRYHRYDQKWGTPRSNESERQATLSHEMDHWKSYDALFAYLKKINTFDWKFFGGCCDDFAKNFKKSIQRFYEVSQTKSRTFDVAPNNQGGMFNVGLR